MCYKIYILNEGLNISLINDCLKYLFNKYLFKCLKKVQSNYLSNYLPVNYIL